MIFRLTKIVLSILGFALLVSCLHPATEVYEARVAGIVLDSVNKRPLAGATVKRVSERDKTEYGVIKTTRFYSDVTTTDGNGRFVLPEQKRIRWWRWSLEYALPWLHCYALIEVSAPGHAPYVSKFADKDLTFMGNPNWACNGIRMHKVVTLVPAKT